MNESPDGTIQPESNSSNEKIETTINGFVDRSRPATPDEISAFLKQLSDAPEWGWNEFLKSMSEAEQLRRETWMENFRPRYFPRDAWFRMVYGISHLITRMQGGEIVE